MNITAVFAEVAGHVAELGKLDVFPYNAVKIPVPGCCVGPVETINYDQTYGRGSDSIRVPLLVVVGPAAGPAAQQSVRDLEALMSGSGERSVKQTLDSVSWVSCSDVFVRDAAPGVYGTAGLTLLGAEWTLDIIGEGETS